MPKSKTRKREKSALQPRYRGRMWVPVRLPTTERDWTHGDEKSIITDGGGTRSLVRVLGSLNDSDSWDWPGRTHYFFSDLHGDSEAFAASLVASGGVKKTGPKPRNFQLSKEGRQARFIIGGDCFDKGPSSLGLLRSVQHLIGQGARVRVLAGNHDVRVLLGMKSVGEKKDVRNEHFFVRTGEKIIPLLREVWEKYLKKKHGLQGIPSTEKCRAFLFPRESWFEEFPKLDGDVILPAQMQRELNRIRKKMDRFEEACYQGGLSLRQVYAAVQKWRSLFLEKDGEFYWFYDRMRLCHRAGSFLFVHAGVDDTVARMLRQGGVRRLNQRFRKALKEAPFDFYYGSLCNSIRTKYRDVDRPFSEVGAADIRRAGITAIVHGHRNLHNGQRLSFRESVINFECDTSLDRHTRKVENVDGRGASVTIVDRRGYILGVSSDYPHIKVFHPLKTYQALAGSFATKKSKKEKS